MTFNSLGLSDSLLRAVAAKGYEKPSPIQASAIPAILEKRDVLATAQTGTGKTAAFTLPLLQLLDEEQPTKRRHVRALILTPTRELAAQIKESVIDYGKYINLRSAVVFGGVKINPQIEELRRGVDILVATPGRFLDLYGQGYINLSHVKTLVLDEADRMLDMGFIHDIKRILALLPKKRQNLLFSATFSPEIRHLTTGLLDNPVRIDIARRNTAAETVQQKMYQVDRPRKTALLTHLIKEENWEQVLVFTRTKRGANRLSQKLARAGIQAAAIHGDKSQNVRTRALADFKSGQICALVATDIAARGLDIDQLPQVVNFELPNVPEDYVHRIGRTGRAGSQGQAVSFICEEEKKQLIGIEKMLKLTFDKEQIAGYEPDPNREIAPPAPRQAQGNRSGHSSRNAQSRNRARGANTSRNNRPGGNAQSFRKRRQKSASE